MPLAIEDVPSGAQQEPEGGGGAASCYPTCTHRSTSGGRQCLLMRDVQVRSEVGSKNIQRPYKER